MKVYQALKKGESHPVFCEDFLIKHAITQDIHLMAVSDGCSSGEDSHFASALLLKTLRQAARELLLQEEEGLAALHRRLIKLWVHLLKDLQSRLQLDSTEMLATALTLLYDRKKNQAFVWVAGDGVVALNGQIISIDQDNRPDYPAYHLQDDFDTWYLSQNNRYLIENPVDLSISSDGIETFRSMKTDGSINPVSFLLLNDELEHLPGMLQRKLTILEKKYGYLPGDDVAIIRLRV